VPRGDITPFTGLLEKIYFCYGSAKDQETRRFKLVARFNQFERI
jgi:hypothetical protein